jgi:hypothetical protein
VEVCEGMRVRCAGCNRDVSNGVQSNDLFPVSILSFGLCVSKLTKAGSVDQATCCKCKSGQSGGRNCC